MKPWMLSLVASTLIAAPPIQSLPTGLRWTQVPGQPLPQVRLELQVRWDAAEEIPGQEGFSAFFGELLTRAGAGSHDHDAFSRILEEHAIRFHFRSLRQGFAWSVQASHQDMEAAFESLALAVTRPIWDGTDVTRTREALHHRVTETSLTARTEARMRDMLRDPSKPTLPNLKTLGRIDPVAMDDFLRRALRPERAVLVVQTDLSQAQIRHLTQRYFGTWGPAQAPRPAMTATSAIMPRLLWVPVAEPAAWMGVRLDSNLLSLVEESKLLSCATDGAPGTQANRHEALDARALSAFQIVHLWLQRQLEQNPPVPQVKCQALENDTGAVGFLLKVAHREPLKIAASLQTWLEQSFQAGPSATDLEICKAILKTRQAADALHPDRQLRRSAAVALGAPDLRAGLAEVDAADVRRILDLLQKPAPWRYALLGVDPSTGPMPATWDVTTSETLK